MMPANYLSTGLFLQIAREIAIGHYDLSEILERYKIPLDQWEQLKDSHRFKEALEREVVNWNAAVNTDQRVKLKAAAIIEEWLIEANQRLHDKSEVLSSKVSLAQVIAKFAGIGVQQGDGNAGEKFSVVINLGGDKIHIEKDITPKVIEGSLDGSTS
jgi:hypothetical protein